MDLDEAPVEREATQTGTHTDDGRVRARTLELLATWAAEPAVLRRWAGDSGNPRLIATYTGLAPRVEQRLATILAQLVDRVGVGATELEREVKRVAHDAAAIRHELSRVKWLRNARQMRLDAAPTLRGLVDVESDARERDEFDALLQALARHLC